MTADLQQLRENIYKSKQAYRPQQKGKAYTGTSGHRMNTWMVGFNLQDAHFLFLFKTDVTHYCKTARASHYVVNTTLEESNTVPQWICL